MRFENDWNGEGDEEQVGDDIAGPHRDELRVALTTFGSGVWHDLPVMVERLAFGQGSNDDGDEGHSEEPSNALEPDFILSSPHLACQPLEELGDREFCDPEAALEVRLGANWTAAGCLQCSVQDPGDENQSASNLTMMNVERSKSVGFGVVGAPEHDDVHEGHPAQQRYDARCHDFVFAEKLFGTDVSST